MLSNHAAESPNHDEASIAQRNRSRGFFRSGDQEAEFKWLEKIDVSRIFVQRFDVLPAKARLSSLEAASAVLDGWARAIPAFGHERCTFEIVFEDGCRYRGHFDLTKSNKHVSLSRYVRKHLTTLAMMSGAQASLQARDEVEIGLAGGSMAESARMMLRNYNI